MKEIEHLNQISSAQKILHVDKNDTIPPIINTVNPYTRAKQVEDILDLNRSQSTVTYQNPNNIASILEITISLPDDPSYLDLDKIHDIYYGRLVNTEDFDIIIAFNDNLDEVSNILEWCDKRSKKASFKNNIISTILSLHPEIKLRQCQYLTNHLKLQILGKGHAKWVTNGSLGEHKYPIKSIDRTISVQEQFYQRLYSKIGLIPIAYQNNNIEMVNKLCRYVLENAGKFLGFLRGTDMYCNTIQNICSVICLIKTEYQKQFILKYQDHFIKDIKLVYDLSSVLLYNIQDLKAAEKFLEAALQNFNNKNYDEEWGRCLFNMGLALSNQGKDIEALNYYKQAYQALPNDYRVLKELTARAIGLEEYILVDQIVEKLTNNDLKILLKISNNLNDLTSNIKDLNKINKINIPEEFHEVLYSMKFLAKYILKKQTIEVIHDKSFLADIKRLKSIISTEGIISTCLFFGQEALARDILNEVKEEIWNNLILQRFKILLQNKNDNLLEEITGYNISEDEKANLHFTAANVCFAENDYEEAAIHLQEAIKTQPENQDYIKATFLSAVLNNNIEKVKEYSRQLDDGMREEVLSPFLNDEISISTNDKVSEELDPQKIHAHFQMIKAQKLNSLSIFSNNNIIWQIDSHSITINQTVYLGEYRGLQYYGYINPEFETIEKYDAFSIALAKGFVKRNQGQNGVKFIENKVIELKISANLRLFTNKIYVSNRNQLLIKFNRSGNHEAVTNFASNNKINYIKEII